MHKKLFTALAMLLLFSISNSFDIINKDLEPALDAFLFKAKNASSPQGEAASYEPIVFEVETFFLNWKRPLGSSSKFYKPSFFEKDGLKKQGGYVKCYGVVLSKKWMLLDKACYLKPNFTVTDSEGAFEYHPDPVSMSFERDGKRVSSRVEGENFKYKLDYRLDPATGFMLLDISGLCIESSKPSRTGFCGPLLDAYSSVDNFKIPQNYRLNILSGLDNPKDYEAFLASGSFFTLNSSEFIKINKVEGSFLVSDLPAPSKPGEPLFIKKGKNNFLVGLYKHTQSDKTKRYRVFGDGFCDIVKTACGSSLLTGTAAAAQK